VGWVVFQKKVRLGTLLDPGGGGLPNPTESTMWGKGSWGARLRQKREFPRGARPHELLGAYGSRRCQLAANASSIAVNFSEPRRRASGRRDLLVW
jgi:hypothetical protein